MNIPLKGDQAAFVDCILDASNGERLAGRLCVKQDRSIGANQDPESNRDLQYFREHDFPILPNALLGKKEPPPAQGGQNHGGKSERLLQKRAQQG